MKDNHVHLDCQGVNVSFAGVRALEDVQLRVSPGAIYGLIGPNGAGKTTLVNVLTQFQQAHAGTTSLGEVALHKLSPHMVRRLGVARTFQGGRLFNELSVVENLEVTGIGLGFKRQQARLEAMRLLEWMGIEALTLRQAGSLPYTDERRVSIARSLMFNPSYLLLDEPAAGMSASEAGELADLVRRIAADIGCGVLLIEHNIGLVMDLSRHIYVLDSGKIVDQGDPAYIRNSEIVQHAYMGSQRNLSAVGATV